MPCPIFWFPAAPNAISTTVSGGAALTEALAMAYVNQHFGKKKKMPKPNGDR